MRDAKPSLLIMQEMHFLPMRTNCMGRSGSGRGVYEKTFMVSGGRTDTGAIFCGINYL